MTSSTRVGRPASGRENRSSLGRLSGMNTDTSAAAVNNTTCGEQTSGATTGTADNSTEDGTGTAATHTTRGEVTDGPW